MVLLAIFDLGIPNVTELCGYSQFATQRIALTEAGRGETRLLTLRPY
jgi:hypothetical protein